MVLFASHRAVLKDEGRRGFLLMKYSGMWISPTQNAVNPLQFDFFLIRIKDHYKKKKKAIPCLKKCWHLTRRQWRGYSELNQEDVHFSGKIIHSMNGPYLHGQQGHFSYQEEKALIPVLKNCQDKKEEHCRAPCPQPGGDRTQLSTLQASVVQMAAPRPLRVQWGLLRGVKNTVVREIGQSSSTWISEMPVHEMLGCLGTVGCISKTFHSLSAL